LLDRGAVLAARHEEIGRGHAERLVPMVAELLAETGARPDGILVDIGPGSFTGVRVGLAAARAFGLAWGCAVDGVPADALVARAAFALANAPDRVAVVLDALRGEVFARAWDRDGPCGPLRAMVPGDAADWVDEIGAAAGNGLALLRPRAGWRDPRGPSSASAVLLRPGDLVPAHPLYIRAPDAKPQA
jgi:tRNA threonylcarbamoyladenosine biosynthesis protein TsaB